jgi:hypothetical protein
VSLDPDWADGQRELIRRGAAYVGVDAQAAGVAALKAWDPVRYATLVHPGDDFSYAIYAQVAKALAQPVLLGGLQAQTVLAMGESQSGGRLNDYVNLVHPQLVDVFDGFMIGGNDGQISDLANLDVRCCASIATSTSAAMRSPTGRSTASGRWVARGTTPTTARRTHPA